MAASHSKSITPSLSEGLGRLDGIKENGLFPIRLNERKQVEFLNNYMEQNLHFSRNKLSFYLRI